MWTCPKCGADVKDSVRLCWICGTAPDGTEFPGTAPVPPPIKLPTRRVVVSVAGVPRRFGLQKVMLMTAVYAVLFAVMAALEVHPIAFVVIGVFFTGVAASQALLFGGHRPREASVVAGAVLFPAIWFTTLLIVDWPSFLERIAEFILWYLAFLCFGCIPLGAGFGYLAGVFSAAVFLVREHEPDEKPGEGLDDDPFAPAVAEVAAEDPPTQETPDGNE